MQFHHSVVLIPLGFALMGAEQLLVRRTQGRGVYRLDDLVANVGHGLGYQVIAFYSRIVLLFWYAELFRSYALFDFSLSALSLPFMVLAVDGVHYWYHRALHRVNGLWAVHVVHHASEEMNLSVSIRNGWYQSVSYSFLDFGFAFLGVRPELLIAALLIRSTYQFGTHTELLRGDLGWFGKVFVTPKHHRLHHASNPIYWDRNFGGMFSLWDRIFGTLVRETEPPRYGIVDQTRISNPFWENIYYYFYLGFLARRARGLGDKLKVFFARPGWLPPGVDPAEVSSYLDRIGNRGAPPFRERARPGQAAYVSVSLAISVMAVVAFFCVGDSHVGIRDTLAAFSLLSLVSLGIWVEGRQSLAFAIEAARAASVLFIPFA